MGRSWELLTFFVLLFLNHRASSIMTTTALPHGVIVPLVTPVDSGYSLDLVATQNIIQHILAHDNAPFLLGTTGESASLSLKKKYEFVEFVCEEFAGKTTLYAGISGNAVEESIAAANQYAKWGVDYAVAHVPNFFMLSPLEMQHYFEYLADRISIPLIVYNIPIVSHHSVPLGVIATLSQHPNIVGLKDSENDPVRWEQVLKTWGNSEEFSILVGVSHMMLPGLMEGAHGIVPSAGNIDPGTHIQMYHHALNQDKKEAEYHFEVAEAITQLYISQSSLGQSLFALKVLMHRIGLCQARVLPPIGNMTESDVAILIRDFESLIKRYDLKAIGKT